MPVNSGGEIFEQALVGLSFLPNGGKGDPIAKTVNLGGENETT